VSTASHLLVNTFRHNIILTLPVLVLLFKFAVRWTTREPLKDVFKSLLTVPLDFVYIAIGILLAGLSRRIPQYASKFSSDREADFYGAVFVFLLFIGACVVTIFDRKVRLCWQKSFAALDLLKDYPQLPLKTTETDEKTSIFGDEYIKTLVWLVFYWIFMILMFMLECVISVFALGGIVKQVT